MKKGIPEITVLMPVYNGERFLRPAVESILAQSYPNFELLVINDGSTDRSMEIVQSYSDPRIKIVHQENRGVAEALRLGVALARGKYLARMDADDESLRHRLELQKRVLDTHPGVCLVHGRHDLIDQAGGTVRQRCGAPHSDKQTKWLLLWGNVITHPTVMLRLQTLWEHELTYRPETNGAEDFDLWNRLAEKGEFHFLPQVLLRYRMNTGSVNRINLGQRQWQAFRLVLRENFERYGITLSPQLIDELAAISGQTRENPLTYRYSSLSEELPKILQSLEQEFERKMGGNRSELFPLQAVQLTRWARCLLHQAPKRAGFLLREAITRHPLILFRRSYLLTVLTLLLPAAAISRINKSRTRPLY